MSKCRHDCVAIQDFTPAHGIASGEIYLPGGRTVVTTETGHTHIERSEGVAGGQPRIVGRRITVADIAVLHERLDQGVDEICGDYDLTLAEVYGALSYYHDHRVEIDEQMRESEAFAAMVKAKTPSKLASTARAGDP